MGGELAIYAPGATADRTRCDGDCMLISAFEVPATHRLTTLPITGTPLALLCAWQLRLADSPAVLHLQ